MFILRPRNHAARLLFLFFTLISSSSFPARPADMLERAAYWPGAFLNLWIWLVIGSVLMHLSLVFPAPREFLRRHPRRWLAAIHGLNAAVDWPAWAYPAVSLVRSGRR